MRKINIVLIIICLVALSVAVQTASAQNTVRISIAVPDNVAEVLEGGLLEQFEAANPGISVYVHETGGGFFGRRGSQDIETHLDEVEESVTEADIVLVNSSNLSVEATRAGYYLDLTPLASVDTVLNSADYYPSVWQSYQWDGGTWALPVSADLMGILYDPLAFDQAGLAYPTEFWTLFDFQNAAMNLTTYDEEGEIDIAGLSDMGSYMPIIVLNQIGAKVYDDSSMLAVPTFTTNPALAEQLEIWSDMLTEGYMSSGFQGFDAPILLAPSTLANIQGMVDDREFIPLPGLDVSAFAISNGTQYPQQAYALASYLTTQSDVVNSVTGILPARQSMAGISSTEGNGGPGGGPGGFSAANPEMTALLQPTVAFALPISDTLFSDLLTDAVNSMVNDGYDAVTALQEVEYTALTNLQTAEERAADLTLQVEAPPVDLVLAPGEIRLNFGIGSNFGRGNQAAETRWESVINEFIASDAEVGQILYKIEGGFTDVSNMATEYDCFYLPSNAVQGADLTLILSLDPLLSSDPTFDPNDLVGNTLSQVQLNGQTWAMPLMLQPEAMLYSVNMFNEYGALLPATGWTVSDFESALRTIKIFPDDPEPFIPQENSNNYMLLLLAAYGGVPVDYSTQPPTINFTDPAAVEAARQVLDLAKAGYIQYEGLGGAFGGRGFRFGFGSDEDVALYNQLLNSFVIDNIARDESYGLTTYPDGTQFNAVSYDIGTAYISSSSPYPQACYRFISAIAQSPELFDGMPARISQLNNPDVLSSQGQSAVDFYNVVNTTLSQPNTLVFPSAFSGGISAVGETIAVDWLYQAFDAYVLEDADLQTELEDAQVKAQTFLDCYSTLPAFDPDAADPGEYFEQVRTCAVQADPDLSEQF